jgi:hypothetical protein
VLLGVVQPDQGKPPWAGPIGRPSCPGGTRHGRRRAPCGQSRGRKTEGPGWAVPAAPARVSGTMDRDRPVGGGRRAGPVSSAAEFPGRSAGPPAPAAPRREPAARGDHGLALCAPSGRRLTRHLLKVKRVNRVKPGHSRFPLRHLADVGGRNACRDSLLPRWNLCRAIEVANPLTLNREAPSLCPVSSDPGMARVGTLAPSVPLSGSPGERLRKRLHPTAGRGRHPL